MNIIPQFIIEDDDLDLLRRFTAYIEIVVRHAKIDYLRRQRHRKKEVPTGLAPLNEADGYEDPLPTNPDEFEITDERLSSAISRLNPLRRQILTLIFLEGLSAQETADKLGCSINYVYLLKHRALKTLRDQLMEEGGSNGRS